MISEPVVISGDIFPIGGWAMIGKERSQSDSVSELLLFTFTGTGRE